MAETQNSTKPQQKLAVGKTIQARYSGLGFSGVGMVSPPGRLFGLIVGMPGAGKSCFLQSHPNAFIINSDLSSTTNPNPKAIMWPAMGPEGIPIEPLSSGFQNCALTWKGVLEKKAQLLRMSEQNQERPETIVVDSLGSAIGLVRKHVTEKSGKQDWKELDGRRAWDDVYEELVRFAVDLRSAGYGFYYVCHLVNAKIPLGDDRYTIRPELTITDSFYKRLFPLFELVAAFESEYGTETTMVARKNPDGSPGPKRPVKTKYKKHCMTVNDESLLGITKCRVMLPDKIELPQEGAWSIFEDIYKSAK